MKTLYLIGGDWVERGFPPIETDFHGFFLKKSVKIWFYPPKSAFQ